MDWIELTLLDRIGLHVGNERARDGERQIRRLAMYGHIDDVVIHLVDCES
ncbi:hypothetical protein [Bradyrhizobium jicamae]|nr:hypothetical protein [Bradyrhizobium jicamae]MBR0938814.1 hypothetical protein [Bradyrhizobium jicamae]